MLTMLSRWQRQRTVRRELLALTDRELNDIGISRYDIGRIAAEVE